MRTCLLILETWEGRERETSIGCLSHKAQWGLNLQPRHVLLSGIEPATFLLRGWHSSNQLGPTSQGCSLWIFKTEGAMVNTKAFKLILQKGYVLWVRANKNWLVLYWPVWLSWLKHCPYTKRLLVQFLIRAHTWVCKFYLRSGCVREATDWCFFLTLMFLFLFTFLSL